MADHYYSVLPGDVEGIIGDPYGKVTVGTGSAGTTYIELKVPDAIASANDTEVRRAVKLFLEGLKEYFEHQNLALGG